VAAVAAILAGSEFSRRGFVRLLGSVALGVAGALVLLSAFTLLRAGQLPDLSRLTLYARIFGSAGYSLLPTPLAGLQLIVYMTFAAALLVAGLRFRRGAVDRLLTGALAYSGVFGFGAGAYYMGRSHPQVLVAMFSAWGLSVVLLAVVALKGLASREGRSATSPVLVFTAFLALGLAATSAGHFPNPLTQLRRIKASASPPLPYNVSTAVNFIRVSTAPGERIVLLAPLGHLIARDAGVTNVSPYSSPSDILSYGQIQEELDALREHRGSRVFVGSAAASVAPEVPEILAADGFRSSSDPASGLTEWLYPRVYR
jgi:hypothetical protein